MICRLNIKISLNHIFWNYQRKQINNQEQEKMEEKKITESLENYTEEINEKVKKFKSVKEEISKVIVGQNEVIDQTLTALLSEGHVLLEGVPGLGKTLLVRTLADSLDLKF